MTIDLGWDSVGSVFAFLWLGLPHAHTWSSHILYSLIMIIDHQISFKQGDLLLLIEEASLQFFLEFKRQLHQENWSDNSLVDGENSFVAGHVSLNEAWTATVDLNASLFGLLWSANDSSIYIDGKFRNSIRPFRPSFFKVSVIFHVIFKLMNKM